MPLLGAANLSLNKAHDRGRQCNNKARADICKQLLARASLDYSPNPPGGWDLARSRVFSQKIDDSALKLRDSHVIRERASNTINNVACSRGSQVR